MEDSEVALGHQVLLGAEGQGIVQALGPAVDQVAGLAVERRFFQIAGDEVLANLWTDAFQQIAQIGKHRVILAQIAVTDIHVVQADAEKYQRAPKEGDRTRMLCKRHRRQRTVGRHPDCVERHRDPQQAGDPEETNSRSHGSNFL